jgi:D-alanine-D-alanine ligase
VVKKVADALEANGHNVEIIDGNMHVVENLQNFMPKVLMGEKLGMVFNMAYGIQGESRYTHIPAMLEMLGIPYVGSSPSGHALALDKVITKIVMQQNGIPTPRYWVFSSEDGNMNSVDFPVIVKPKMESVSFGLRVVNNQEELKEAVAFITEEFKQQALVEQFIRGREFAVGLIGNSPIETFPIVEFELESPDAIQSVEDKQMNPKKKICPADISPDLASEMRRLSIEAFNALQLRDFARVDIRLDENNNIYLLEINSMASLGLRGSYVFAAAKAGYDYSALTNKILEVASLRYFTDMLQENSKTSADERKPLQVRIRSIIGNRLESAEQLLKQLVDINTHVRNVEGVNLLANKLIKQFSSLGFHHQIIPHVEIGNSIFLSNSDTEEYDILFLCNLDNDTPIHKHRYFSKVGQKYFGTGIWEHKGGIIVLLLALQALRHTRLLRKVKMGILLTSDDALQGKFERNLVKEKSLKANYIIGLKGGSLNGGIVTSRSGAAVYHFTMNLKKTDDPGLVPFAANVLSRLINQWAGLSDPENGLLVAPGNVSMQTNISEAYAHGEVSLSVRFDNSDQMEIVEEKIRKTILKKYKSDLLFQMEGGPRRNAMIFNSNVEYFWKIIKQIGERLDVRLLDEHRWSSSDIGFVSEDKYRIDGMGAIGVRQANGEEYILKHSIKERATLLAITIAELNKVFKMDPSRVMVF